MTDQQITPPPLPASDEPDEGTVQWFYVANGVRQGPVSAAAIRAALVRREITLKNWVWRQGMPEWQQIKNSDLANLMTAEPPPLSALNTASGFRDPHSSPPSPPNVKPKSRWLWLKIVCGALIGGVLVIRLIAAADTPQLELKRYGDGKGFDVLNVGTKSITITNITINDRKDCAIGTLGQAFRQLGQLKDGNKAAAATVQFEKDTLAIGEKNTYVSPCLIVRAEIETDHGTATYSFNSER